MRPNANHSVDVTVLGGGPAGTATALALSRLGHSVVVIETSTYNNLRIGEMLPLAFGLCLLESQTAANQDSPPRDLNAARAVISPCPLADTDVVAHVVDAVLKQSTQAMM